MARRKLSKKQIRTLQKLGGGASYAVTLPMDEIDELGWKAKQKLEVIRYGDGFLVRDWKSKSKD